MMKALVQGTRICEVVADDKTFQVHDSLTWVDVANGTTTFDTYVDGNVVQYTEPPVTYADNRRGEYPEMGHQLDMLFRDIAANKVTTDGELYKALAKVKSDNPKPE